MEIPLFGKDENKQLLKFTLHSISLGIPGLLLGISVEKAAEYLEEKSFKLVGLAQMILNILILFILSNYLKNFSSEFQKTYSGLLFVALFFNSQESFVKRLKNIIM